MNPDLRKKIDEAVQRFKSMPPEEREALLAQQRRSFTQPAPSRSRSSVEAELSKVRQKLHESRAWGAGVAALLEWERDLERELHRHDAQDRVRSVSVGPNTASDPQD